MAIGGDAVTGTGGDGYGGVLWVQIDAGGTLDGGVDVNDDPMRTGNPVRQIAGPAGDGGDGATGGAGGDGIGGDITWSMAGQRRQGRVCAPAGIGRDRRQGHDGIGGDGGEAIGGDISVDRHRPAGSGTPCGSGANTNGYDGNGGSGNGRAGQWRRCRRRTHAADRWHGRRCRSASGGPNDDIRGLRRDRLRRRRQRRHIGGDAISGGSTITVNGSLVADVIVQATARATGGAASQRAATAVRSRRTRASRSSTAALDAGTMVVATTGQGGEATGVGGIGGDGTGGWSEFVMDGGIVDATDGLVVWADAVGGAAAQGSGGNAEGGDAEISVGFTSTLTAGNIEAVASAEGGDGADAGGDATSGFISLAVDDSSLTAANMAFYNDATGGDASGPEGIGGDAARGDGLGVYLSANGSTIDNAGEFIVSALHTAGTGAIAGLETPNANVQVVLGGSTLDTGSMDIDASGNVELDRTTNSNITVAGDLYIDASGYITLSDDDTGAISADEAFLNAGIDLDIDNLTGLTALDLTAGELANFHDLTVAPTITVTSRDIFIADFASIGQYGTTNLVTLNAVGNEIYIGTPQAAELPFGTYILDEDGDIFATNLVINAVGDIEAFTPTIFLGDAEMEGTLFSSQSEPYGTASIQINTPGSIIVNGLVDYYNLAPTDTLALNAGEDIIVDTDTGKIQMSAPNQFESFSPSGQLALSATNIWVAQSAIISQLEADPNFAGRNAALALNSGVADPLGFVIAGGVAVEFTDTFLVQNSGTAANMGGITVGDDGLSIDVDNEFGPGRHVHLCPPGEDRRDRGHQPGIRRDCPDGQRRKHLHDRFRGERVPGRDVPCAAAAATTSAAAAAAAAAATTTSAATAAATAAASAAATAAAATAAAAAATTAAAAASAAAATAAATAAAAAATAAATAAAATAATSAAAAAAFR